MPRRSTEHDPNLASLRQLSGARKTGGSRKPGAVGRRTSSRTSSLVTDARSDIFDAMVCAEKPVCRWGRRNHGCPRRCGPTRWRCRPPTVSDPHLRAVDDRSSPERVARVRIPAGSEPKSGWVRPKHPILRPAAMSGSHCSLSSSLPNACSANIASEPCTLTSERMPSHPPPARGRPGRTDRRRPCAAVALKMHAEKSEFA